VQRLFTNLSLLTAFIRLYVKTVLPPERDHASGQMQCQILEMEIEESKMQCVVKPLRPSDYKFSPVSSLTLVMDTICMVSNDNLQQNVASCFISCAWHYLGEGSVDKEQLAAYTKAMEGKISVSSKLNPRIGKSDDDRSCNYTIVITFAEDEWGKDLGSLRLCPTEQPFSQTLRRVGMKHAEYVDSVPKLKPRIQDFNNRSTINSLSLQSTSKQREKVDINKVQDNRIDVLLLLAPKVQESKCHSENNENISQKKMTTTENINLNLGKAEEAKHPIKSPILNKEVPMANETSSNTNTIRPPQEAKVAVDIKSKPAIDKKENIPPKHNPSTVEKSPLPKSIKTMPSQANPQKESSSTNTHQSIKTPSPQSIKTISTPPSPVKKVQQTKDSPNKRLSPKRLILDVDQKESSSILKKQKTNDCENADNISIEANTPVTVIVTPTITKPISTSKPNRDANRFSDVLISDD
jgi:hypothetical protein